MTIYLWSGEPVAYLGEDSVYGFNGEHLGWYRNGAIYDQHGQVVVAAAGRFVNTAQLTADIKGYEHYKPFKSFKEFKPFKPLFSESWSDTPARVYLAQGTK